MKLPNGENAQLGDKLDRYCLNQQHPKGYGTHYKIRFLMETDAGTWLVLSCWIVRNGEEFPRLTRTYPIDQGAKINGN